MVINANKKCFAIFIMFYDCTSLVSIYLGSGVKEICSFAFKGTNVKDFYCLAFAAPKLYGNIRYTTGGTNPSGSKCWHEALEDLDQATLHIFKTTVGYSTDLANMTYYSCSWKSHFKSVQYHSSFTETHEGWR